MHPKLQEARKKLDRFEKKSPFFFRIFLFTTYGGLAGTLLLLLLFYILSFTLPTLDQLEKPQYDLPTQVYDKNNRLVTEFYIQRRVVVPYEDIPPIAIQALLAIEDNRFYKHFGIDPIRIAKAIIVDIACLCFKQGASTLTQQTAKMFLLSSDRKLIRKFKELLLSLRMEQRFSKEKILELYLNKAYFGHRAYGIEAAAQGYFSKSARDLTLEEAAMLVGLVQAPSYLAPTASIKRATAKRNLVLKMMVKEEFITEEAKEVAINTPIQLRLGSGDNSNEASYFTEHIRQYVKHVYGVKQLYKGGLKVYTTMDLERQIAAQKALEEGLEAHDKRQGFRGPMTNLWKEVGQTLHEDIYDEEKGLLPEKVKEIEDEDQRAAVQDLFDIKKDSLVLPNRFEIGGKVLGLVTKVTAKKASVDLGKHQGSIYLQGMEWARPANKEEQPSWRNKLRDLRKILKYGDIIELKIADYYADRKDFSLSLHQRPIANGSLFSVDPRTMQVQALSGGYDFAQSEFNRAIQSKRQPGSSFKPIVYSLAFEHNYTRSTIVLDAPLVINGWKPINYSGKFSGPMPLRRALALSKNLPTLRIANSLGVKPIIEHARRMGITADLPKDITIALGTASITLREMVRTYAVFANKGILKDPYYILKVTDPNGKILEEYLEPELEKPLSPESAFLITRTLQDVVQSGTATRARALGRPAAGKTGTTNDYTDAWFMGFTPQLLTGVYVGNDNPRIPLGVSETGSRTALPIWLSYTKKSLRTEPILPFRQPKGIEMVKIVPSSGLLDCHNDPTARTEYFKVGTAPMTCAEEQSLEQTLASEEEDEEREGDVEDFEEL